MPALLPAIVLSAARAEFAQHFKVTKKLIVRK
jgi:hypothetical protein